MTELLTVRDSIRSCTACNLRNSAQQPVPWSGPTPASYLFIGMAPGRWEDEKGENFIGKSGIYLRTLIAQHNFPKDVAFANSTCCYPGSNGKGGDIKPALSELIACRPNLLAQIACIQPRYIFLVGTTALEAFRPDLELMHTHGKPLYYDGTDHNFPITWSQGHIYLWSIYHPAAALRSPKYEASIKEDMATFWEWRRGGMPWPEVCFICSGEPHHSDGWGYMTCELHARRQGSLF